MIGPGRFPGVSTDPEDREARSFDFGGMIRRMPQAVAIPQGLIGVSHTDSPRYQVAASR